MGSLAPDHVRATGGEGDEEIHVLVTGFGPFLDNRVNPSFLIASGLPLSHVVTTRVSESHPSASSGSIKTTIIHIHSLPEPVEVSYAYVNDTIPSLLFSHSTDSGAGSLRSKQSPPSVAQSTPISTDQTRPHEARPNYDITLNLGLAPGRTFYALETKARRDGYIRKDVHGHLPISLARRGPGIISQHDFSSGSTPSSTFTTVTTSSSSLVDQHVQGGANESGTQPASQPSLVQSSRTVVPEHMKKPTPLKPAELRPTFDMNRIYQHWTNIVNNGDKALVQQQDDQDQAKSTIRLELSYDAGRYLCEYIFYTCLFEYWKQTGDRSPEAEAEAEASEVFRDIRTTDSKMGGSQQSKDTVWNNDGNANTEGQRPCFFLHVPSGDAEKDIQRGVKVVLGLLEAICRCT